MIGAIEDAMLARLLAAREAGLLPYLRTIKGYGGELDPDRLAEAIRQFPAVWLFYSGEERPRELVGDRLWRYRARFAVYVAARSLRNEASSRQGAGPDTVGSYQVLSDVRRLLEGQQLGLAIGPLVPGEVRSVAQEHGLSVYRLELACEYDAEAPLPLPAERLADLLRVHLDWDVPPLGNVQPPLPAAAADARDDVLLEGAD